MIKEDLKKYFPEDRVDLIWDMESEGVKFENLSLGQKKSFIAIAKLIDKNFTKPKKKSLKDDMSNEDVNKTINNMFGMQKRHVTLNGPAGT